MESQSLQGHVVSFWEGGENIPEHRGSDKPRQKRAQHSKAEIRMGASTDMFVGGEALEVEWACTNGLHFVCEVEIRFLRVKKSICPASLSS